MSPYFKNCVLGSDVVTHICIFSWPLAVSRDLLPPDPYIPYKEIPIGTEFHRKLEHIFNPRIFPEFFATDSIFCPQGIYRRACVYLGGGRWPTVQTLCLEQRWEKTLCVVWQGAPALNRRLSAPAPASLQGREHRGEGDHILSDSSPRVQHFEIC